MVKDEDKACYGGDGGCWHMVKCNDMNIYMTFCASMWHFHGIACKIHSLSQAGMQQTLTLQSCCTGLLVGMQQSVTFK